MLFLIKLWAHSLQLYYHTNFFAGFFQELLLEVSEKLLLQNKYQCLPLVFPNKQLIWHYIDLSSCRSLTTCVGIKMHDDLNPSLKLVIANRFLGFNLNGNFHLKKFYHWGRSMFLYFGASSVPILSRTSNFFHLGPSSVSVSSGTNNLLHTFYNWEHL